MNINKLAMTRDWESTFTFWSQSPSPSEQERCERTIKQIKAAIVDSAKLRTRGIKTFTQGSFRNRVNVRQDSDVDVGVMLHDYFLARYPKGKGDADFGNSSAGYSYSTFKDELEQALVARFGRAAVVRGNKALNVKAASYKVDADVVPLFEFREYGDSGFCRAGVALIPDNSIERIENYPERLMSNWPPTPLHYENGKSKNDATWRRFRGLVRILKKLRNEMDDAGNIHARAVPSYLLECLVWNVPDNYFSHYTWEERVQAALRFLWQQTKDRSLCGGWFEVDAIKYLFHGSQPWTLEQAQAFVNAAWDTVGGKP